MSGRILVVSGPSGCGKSSLLNKILEGNENIYFSISTTTRDIREGEREGVNYYYVSKEEFEKDIDEGLFLEWAEVHGNYYGTSLKPVNEALKSGKLVIFDIDVQGHRIVKEKFSDKLTSLFITTPSAKELKDRLINRGTDSIETIEKRVQNSLKEMDSIDEYDLLLVNDDFDNTLKSFQEIVNVELMKIDKKSKDRFINKWYNL